jgi:leucyl/phenylalanyl-tRNA--protein transferase
VLYPAKLKISKSMRQVLRSGKFRVTFDTCFAEVIQACSASFRKDQDGTWITNDMIAAYTELHRLGHAQSIEVWQGEELVGGLYGVQVGHVFCGESMFSKVSNASKTNKYNLIDCQVHTEHLESLGAEMVSREEYMRMLR